MKLTCILNGEPAEIELDRDTLLKLARQERGALNTTEAAVYLGCCEQTVRNLRTKETIKDTSYGTYPIASLEAHLAAEMKGRK